MIRKLVNWLHRKFNPPSKPPRPWAGWTTNHGHGRCIASGRIDVVLRPNHTMLTNVDARQLNWNCVVRFRRHMT